MNSIVDVIENAALKLVTLDNENLAALAELHTLFQKTDQLAEAHPDNQQDSMRIIRNASRQIAHHLEKIILDECDDPETYIQAITDATKTIQDIAQAVQQNCTPEPWHFSEILGIESAAADSTNTDPQQSSTCIELPDNVDADIFREFLANIPHQLEALESGILAAEKSATADHINLVKGILHNMKGESALMNLNQIASACHDAETLLADPAGDFPGEKLLACKDWIQNSINELINSQNAIDQQSQTAEDKSTTAATEPISASEDSETAPPAPSTEMIIAEGDIPLVVDFINESNEHLETAEVNLLEIEESPDDPEKINAIFRAFHTIKGVAGFLNLKEIGALAHATENLLDLARKGNLVLAGTNIDIVFESIDVMKRMMGELQTAISQNSPIALYPALDELISRIKACAAGETPMPRFGEVMIQQAGVTPETVRDGLKIQRDHHHDKKLGEVMVDAGMVKPETIEQTVSALETQPAKSASVQTPKQSSETRPVRKISTESTIKVTTNRLDAMINMVGELVIAQLMVSQDLGEMVKSNQRLERNARHLEKITRDLQELSMSMRMVPVQGVFQKMARLVRDLSHKAGKDIDFQMIGAETELDRNVVEAIADPLVHMIRNSVDHGIEPPEERIRNGKPKTGHVTLRAYHKGGNIVIQITDDGRGLNKERILKKALDAGVVKDGTEISDQDIYRLIFHAGLSTAEKITSISGRGVGMDVVRKNIESLRGRIDIDSTPGKGSTFTIYLPLTLAVIDGQEVTVGKEHYIVPIISIEQNFRPTPSQISTTQGGRGEMIMVRENLLPLVRLHELFNVQPEHTNPCDSLVVIVSDGEQRCGIQVDSLLGQQQVVIKNLGAYMGAIQGISGGAIMGNGNVSLILDIPGLIQLANKNHRNRENDAA